MREGSVNKNQKSSPSGGLSVACEDVVTHHDVLYLMEKDVTVRSAIFATHRQCTCTRTTTK
jgi:hypothetical protein